MTYAIYHIPGKKIGVTNNIKYRVEEQQGYNEGEYEILEMSDDINYVSYKELELQKQYGYKVDEKLYKQLKCNQMNINVTEQTTTFPCPVNKLKGQLMDNINMKWETEHGECLITENSIKWIMQNVNTSKYNTERCYVYNKAFARWFDNNDTHGTRTGGIMSDSRNQKCNTMCRFDKIRLWAEDRGLYHKGDPKTQTLKLMEEAGEICRAVLKKDEEQIIDGIGDCVVVLTNLAHLAGTSIEECIDAAYNEIKDRTGKMSNGTFKKINMSEREIMDAKNGIESRKEYAFRDPVVRHVCDKFVKRSDIGYEKYNNTLDDERRFKMKNLQGYLNDIQEELMDAVLYIQAAREELQDLSEEALIDKIKYDEEEI